VRARTPPGCSVTPHGAIVEDLAGDWRRLDERVERLSDEIEAIARQDASCERLMSVPGVGPIISSAMVAAIEAKARHCCRAFVIVEL
jgi:transposase